ncbi:hypothetical protein [Streptomyces chattanoogensis]|uniref:hypothetical protein n=1 Tax=Streptomyces chattanoogensis TaxID=66876 RepID=UPI0036BAA46F
MPRRRSSELHPGEAGSQLLVEVMRVVRQVGRPPCTRSAAAACVITNLGDYQDSPHLHFHVIHRGNAEQQLEQQAEQQAEQRMKQQTEQQHT